MNRSIALIGLVLIALGFALVAYPIAFLGHEQLDIEQELGFLVAPVGLVVVMLGALAHDPELTTVGGTFGNPEAALGRPSRPGNAETRAAHLYNPHEPVNCRNCGSVITADLAVCPRCARPRECRTCLRPLAFVQEVVICPGCSRTEALCRCPRLARPASSPQLRGSVRRR